ncbi:putative alcohol dehydrogenase [Danaus plexippus plexippus]|uniref:Alcohol dehydrogenase n=1 Tax=Danaus plexippus plexippus TaxID=278856 RepID=A0A212F0G8_DANPL|nr:15-hydroxyprostaglandin dehydrogenase [NAD(+)]-like [Danaus plexippus plexippus]OWR47239.1 putative alcohol dehydrogenase [Danaus plexippus plexippus]
MFDLKNKIVLITGGSQGIGAKAIEFLLQENIKHIANLDVAEKAGVAQQDELNKKYGTNILKFYKCDVSNEEQLMGAYQTILDEQGSIDIVINNAGIANDSKEKYKKEIDINFLAATTSTLKAIEIMRKDEGGNGGVVLNISSAAALCQDELLPIYAATKSAILQFSNCIGMPKYYSRTGVRVVTLCYGGTESHIFRDFDTIDKTFVNHFNEVIVKVFPPQKVESAASALVEVLKNGESGSTWMSANNKPVQDITPTIKKAYGIMSEAYTNFYADSFEKAS